MNHFEARRSIAQQPQRARRVAARQHEAVAAGAEAVDEVVQHAAQAREALEGAQLQELVEQERRRLAAARARPREEAERLRRTPRGASPAQPARPAGNGDAPVTARRNRSGVVAVRSTSMYCAAVRPMRSRSWCSSVVRPLPHPPTSTGMRDGDASSAAATRRVSVERGVSMRVPLAWAFEGLRARPQPALQGSRRRHDGRTPMPGSQVSTRSSFSSASAVPSATTTMPACSE